MSKHEIVRTSRLHKNAFCQEVQRIVDLGRDIEILMKQFTKLLEQNRLEEAFELLAVIHSNIKLIKQIELKENPYWF